MKTVNFMKKSEPTKGLHPAIVTSIDDPLKIGRIKVSIPHLFGEEESPWIYPFGYNCGLTLFHVPSKETLVFVFFLEGDVQSGMYGSGTYDKSKSKIFDADYPNSYGWEDESGNYFIGNKKTGKMEFHSYTGLTITLQGGDCVIKGNRLTLDFPIIETTGNFSSATGASGIVCAGPVQLAFSGGMLSNIAQ